MKEWMNNEWYMNEGIHKWKMKGIKIDKLIGMDKLNLNI